MIDDGIYRKTEKGRIEIATRANKLGMRERTMLIMVDDKTTRSGFLSRSAHPNTGDILDSLRAQGFIEIVYGIGPAPAAPAPPLPPFTSPASDARPGSSVSQIRPAAGALSPAMKDAFQRLMAKYIGPMAEIVCSEHFEHAGDPAAVAHALANEIPSHERAAQFRAEAAKMLESGAL